jgi:hypothetical protein
MTERTPDDLAERLASLERAVEFGRARGKTNVIADLDLLALLFVERRLLIELRALVAQAGEEPA